MLAFFFDFLLTCFQFTLQWTVPASLLSWWKRPETCLLIF